MEDFNPLLIGLSAIIIFAAVIFFIWAIPLIMINALALISKKSTVHELGKEYINRYASGQSDRSTSYKSTIADKIRAKHRNLK